MASETLKVEHSKAFTLTGVLQNGDGTPLDGTSVTLRFEARVNYGDASPAIAKISTHAGDFTFSGDHNEIYEIHGLPSDTAGLPNDGRLTRLKWLLQGATDATDAEPLTEGDMIVTPTVIVAAP